MKQALLCIDTETGRVRRYLRNVHGKCWCTHEAMIDNSLPSLSYELENFRRYPAGFKMATIPHDHIPDGAA